MSVYTYTPLSSQRAIRVVILEPAAIFDEPLRCTLREVSLDEPGCEEYDAISYVWGSPAGDRPLFCDGDVLLITPNCDAVLRRLRESRRGTRAIWADAICIDQTSIPEKNQQVPLMGDIYQGATNVFIWLGEGNEAIAALLTSLNETLCARLQGIGFARWPVLFRNISSSLLGMRYLSQ